MHGYTDYFFHTELADHFANRGFAFYALDLRKCGRSRAPGQTPHFITDLARYDTELEHSLSIINEQNRSAKVLVYGHSAGGLIVSLWLDRLRQRGEITRAGVTGLVLNSPFLDLQGPAILRLPLTSAFFAAMARMRPKWVARPPKKAVTVARCTGTMMESSTTTCNGNRWAVSRSPSAGFMPAVVATHGYIAGSTSVCPT